MAQSHNNRSKSSLFLPLTIAQNECPRCPRRQVIREKTIDRSSDLYACQTADFHLPLHNYCNENADSGDKFFVTH
jgi:predicted RNA-binding Zn-ribbon protein involved in translation (DUF1610 family)